MLSYTRAVSRQKEVVLQARRGIHLAYQGGKSYRISSCSHHKPNHQDRSFGHRALSTRASNMRPLRRSSSVNVVAASAAVLLAGSYMAFGSPYRPSTIANDGPGGAGREIRTKSTGYGGKQAISMLTPGQVTAWLREHEESYLVERGKGVLRYDVCQLASNNPIEDDRAEHTVQVPLIARESDERTVADWSFWGIYDGHSGWTTSAKLRDALISSVLSELDKTYQPASPDSGYRVIPSPEAIDTAIRKGFVKLDNEIVNDSVTRLLDSGSSNKAAASEVLAPALSGSCGLLAFYDSFSHQLRVAVAGDSRAVLGSRDVSTGRWTATALSTDQTGSNVDEANRIRSEHPGEEATAIRNGRVLGSLEPTRSFGDARYKWTRDIQHKVASQFFGRRTPSELRSPPYVTADPVVTTTQVHPERGDFLVMGSDGLFEMLSNEEVVSLVAQWVDAKHPEYVPSGATVPKEPKPGVWSRMFGARTSADTPYTVEDVSTNKEAQKQPLQQRRGRDGPNFVVEDENAATHLIRNALGGADRQQVSMLVSIPSPLSRSYRDDLTVTVVFFGDSPDGPNDTAGVKVNHAGTRNGLRAGTKPKL